VRDSRNADSQLRLRCSCVESPAVTLDIRTVGMVREVPGLGTQTQVDASARLGEVALNDRETEAAMNQAIVSDERDNLRRSCLKSTPVFVHHGSALREMNISGNQVLVALAIAFCLAGPILWAFVRYWLFAP